MPGKTKCSEGRKAQYKTYGSVNRKGLNRIRRIERHLKKHPNDEQTRTKL